MSRMTSVAVAVTLVSTWVCAEKTETLVGRGDKAVIIRDGQVQEIDLRTVTIKNQAKPGAMRTPKRPVQEQTVQPTAEAPKTAPEPKTKEVADAEKKAVAELVKKQDIQRLRQVQKEGGWFYTDDNLPLSPEELEKRLQSGDIADIKAVDIHLKEWKTETEKQ